MKLIRLFGFVLPFFAIAAKSPISVLDFSYNPPSDSGTLASLDLTSMGVLPPSFTICTAIMIKAWTNGASTSVHIFKAMDQEGNHFISLILNIASTSWFKFEIQGEISKALIQFPWIFPLDWVHTCMSVEQSSGKINLMVNGALLENRTFDGIKTMDYSSILSIKIGEKFSGKWANFNIFSSSLSAEKMKNITSASNTACGDLGDLVRWDTARWVLSGNGGVVEELSFDDRPCRRVSTMHIYHMEAMHTQDDCMKHCQKLWGRSPSVQTEKGWEMIMREVIDIAGNKSNIKTLPKIRLSATDGEEDWEVPFSRLSHWNETETLGNETVKLEAKKGIWRDYYTGARLDNFTKPWMKQHEKDSKNLWLDTSQPLESSWDQGKLFYFDLGCLCEYDIKYGLVWDHPPVLTLWGVEVCSALLSKDYWNGLMYSPKQSLSNPKSLFYVGGMSTQIHYDGGTQKWVLTDAVSKVRAETKASKESFALGKQEWTITGDHSNCHEGMTYTTNLKLSGCNSLEHFTCDDGQCIALEQRCDQLPNCRDKSDERGCNILVLEDGYNKRIPPITTSGSTMIPVTCDVSIVLSKVVHIDEEDHAIEFQFEILLEWNENRVSYHNLKQDMSLNTLNDTEMKRIWLPLVI